VPGDGTLDETGGVGGHHCLISATTTLPPLSLLVLLLVSPVPLESWTADMGGRGVTILAALWMRYSASGRAIYAVGGNAEAARLCGISQPRTIVMVFALHGLFAGAAALLYATQLRVIQSTVPPNLELTIITASVVGGVSILGGVGTVVGSTLAAVLIAEIASALVFTDVSPYWIRAVQGVLILVTVIADILRRRRMAGA